MRLVPVTRLTPGPRPLRAAGGCRGGAETGPLAHRRPALLRLSALEGRRAAQGVQVQLGHRAQQAVC